MSRLLALLACFLLSAAPTVAQEVSRAPAVALPGPQRSERIEAELVPMSQWAAPGSTAIVAIRQQIKPGWHTYWRNPGDSGGPTTLNWTLPAGVSAGEIVWPLPTRQRLQSLVNLGYEGVIFLPVPIEIPADARVGTTLPLTVRALFLVCSDQMCVPDELTLRLDLPIRAGAAPLEPRYGAAIQTIVETAPRPAGIRAAVRVSEGRVILDATGGPLVGADLSRATFFPFEPGLVSHGPPLSAEAGPQGLALTLEPASTLAARGLTGPLAGVLATDKGAWEIMARPGAALPGAPGRRISVEDAGSATRFDWLSAGRAALFALIGGLILNLMPCVFPVLAMKAASLAGSAHDPAEARREGFAFLAGVLTTFLLLASVLLILRAGGQAVGWGFQLQSPAVVASLSVLMLVIGLNLSGVFEIGLRLQAVGGASLARRSGSAGAFATGVLAVVVAAPCTAPFMAAALGAALVMPAVAALLIFVLLGLGLALPYLLISLSPGLLARFPRPGVWMERLRGTLAFPMYGAALWLAWVFARQQGLDALGLLFVGGLAAALGLWLFGWRQIERMEGRGAVVVSILSALALVVAVAMAGLAVLRPAEPQAAAAASGPLASIPWSLEAVAEAQAAGRPVFVDFTADWCVTCKINERSALASPRTAEAIAKTNAVFMVADWTLRDDRIARELERHGRSGVPLYLVYAPGEAEPRILPQLLTDGVVVEALEDAAS